MNQYVFNLLILILSGLIFPAIPVVAYAVYRANQVPAIWKKIDILVMQKAEENDVKGLDERLRKMEISFADKMGRFDAGLERFESIERRFEKYLESKGG